MSLNIVPGDVLNYIEQIFTSFWPIIAIGLGLLAAPSVINICKAAFTGEHLRDDWESVLSRMTDNED